MARMYVDLALEVSILGKPTWKPVTANKNPMKMDVKKAKTVKMMMDPEI